MGSKDGFSNNKLLDDFGCGDLTRPKYIRHISTKEQLSI
uniref:Uncharacterized protein n=1 Tax=Oryza sativa subsp. japonica TaxID=39947 RepID=Q7XE77_ORYSJ|nr:hypothetical protein LOC_Os10g29774 [Oryza sativa Japonica Group]